jgi:hypothetical protein
MHPVFDRAQVCGTLLSLHRFVSTVKNDKNTSKWKLGQNYVFYGFVRCSEPPKIVQKRAQCLLSWVVYIEMAQMAKDVN